MAVNRNWHGDRGDLSRSIVTTDVDLGSGQVQSDEMQQHREELVSEQEEMGIHS